MARPAILVLEADPAFREALARALLALGARPLVAGSGVEALAALRAGWGRPQAALVDLGADPRAREVAVLQRALRAAAVPLITLTGTGPGPAAGPTAMEACDPGELARILLSLCDPGERAEAR